MKKIIVLGSGARQASIAWKLCNSPNVEVVYFMPGNTTKSEKIRCVNLDITDYNLLYKFYVDNDVDYIITENSMMLKAGIVDYFSEKGVKIFGASKDTSKLEWSKAFGKKFMQKYTIPTPGYAYFDSFEKAKEYVESKEDGPLVIKADGLISGRGVSVCSNRKEALIALSETMEGNKLNEAGRQVVIEEMISGPELSAHIVCDGTNYILFPFAQDHKPLYDGNKGPNTGGMGTYTPVSWVDDDLKKEIIDTIIIPTMDGLKAEGMMFKGCIFPGIMLTENGPMLLEYNMRFGAPETQSFMMLLESDLDELFSRIFDGRLSDYDVVWFEGAAATVELTAGTYPDGEDYGTVVNIEPIEDKSIQIFHNGTELSGDHLVTAGGKILSVSARAESLNLALEKIYRTISGVHYEGMRYRKDIGTLRNVIPKRSDGFEYVE